MSVREAPPRLKLALYVYPSLNYTPVFFGFRKVVIFCACTVCEYDALLRTSFKRHDFMARALNLIVAGIVMKCSIVLQIGIYVREKVSFAPC